MKRTITLLAVVALVGGGAYVVFAGDPMGGGMMNGGTMGGGMQSRGMMGRGMQNRGMMGGNMMSGGMMGPMMRSTSMVPTSDGGVIVLMGNELLKYDKDLNLTKQAQVNFDWENWQKMMMEHRNMMMGGQQSGSQQ
jgi:hypothetical protein